jgi:hypothetical protein
MQIAGSAQLTQNRRRNLMLSVANPSPLHPCIAYREEYVCGCGLTILVAASGSIAAGATFAARIGDEGYRHCGKDTKTHFLPGPLFAVWEKHGENWVSV